MSSSKFESQKFLNMSTEGRKELPWFFPTFVNLVELEGAQLLFPNLDIYPEP